MARRPGGQPASAPARRGLARLSLTTGRDLLQTHFAPGTGSTRHSPEWAYAITSPPVTRALLTEIASLSRRIARQGTDLALSPSVGAPADAQGRRRAERGVPVAVGAERMGPDRASARTRHHGRS